MYTNREIQSSLVQRCITNGISYNIRQTEDIKKQWASCKTTITGELQNTHIHEYLDEKLSTYEVAFPPGKELVATLRESEPQLEWRWAKLFLRGYTQHVEAIEKFTNLSSPAYYEHGKSYG